MMKMYVIGCEYRGEDLEHGAGWRRFDMIVVPQDYSCVLVQPVRLSEDEPGRFYFLDTTLQTYKRDNGFAVGKRRQ